MRRAFALALVPVLVGIAACSAPASAPRPPPPPATPRAEPPSSTIELSGTREATVLTRRAPGGSAIYTLPLGKVRQVVGAADGGAYVMVEGHKDYRVWGELVRVDAQGKEAWRAGGSGSKWPPEARLLTAVGWVFVVEREYVNMIEPSGRIVRAIKQTQPVTSADQGGGVLAIADDTGVTRLSSLASPMWSVKIQLFPSLEPSIERSADRKVAVGSDGTVLTGASDGSLVALDADGKALYQLGVRGAVARIEARPDGEFVVSTSAGLTTTIGPGGAVRREGLRGADPVSLRARDVVDLRKDAREETAPPASPSVRPTMAHRAHREGIGATLFHELLSVVASAPDDVWALFRPESAPGKDPQPLRLAHRDAQGWTDLGVPAVPFAKEVYQNGSPAAVGEFFPSSLALGPGGALLVIGTRGPYPRRPCVIERTSAGFRERRDLFPLLASLPDPRYETEPSYARSTGGREVLCTGSPAICIELGPGLPPRILPPDQGKTMPEEAGQKRDLSAQAGLIFAGETLWRANAWAGGEAEVWGVKEAALTRWNGTSFERRETPLTALRDVWGSAKDDLWLTGTGGVARFDGERWWRILEIDDDRRAALSVTGSGRGDVWVYGKSGLWHVTPDPRALPDLEGTAALAPPASAPSRAIVIAGAEPAYHLERVVLDVSGGAPMRSALSIVEGPGGLLWLHDGARLVEHDGTRTRVLQQGPRPEPFVCWSAPEPDCEVCVGCSSRRPEPLGCQRCAAPTAAGEGALLIEDGLLSIAAGRPAGRPIALQDLSAAAATPSGALWAVSTRNDDALPHALLLGPLGLRFVPGLPAASYADVAVRADDDLWMAGGLATGEEHPRSWPEGEGTLVHFDGHGFTRFRGVDGALLSVASAAPNEAWAVGVAGGVLHVKAGVAQAFHLERAGGAKLPVTLRGVSASGPDEVWLAGSSSTLLRWDGQALRQVDTRAAGKQAAFSAVIAPGAKPGWVVGPGGIWKVLR